jgi:hypothetical protein
LEQEVKKTASLIFDLQHILSKEMGLEICHIWNCKAMAVDRWPMADFFKGCRFIVSFFSSNRQAHVYDKLITLLL